MWKTTLNGPPPADDRIRGCSVFVEQQGHAIAAGQLPMIRVADQDMVRAQQLAERIRDALNAGGSPGKRRIAVVIDGGLLQDVITDDPSLEDVEVACIDYDTEGGDEEDIVMVDQGSGVASEGAYVGYRGTIEKATLGLDAVFKEFEPRLFSSDEGSPADVQTDGG